MDCSEHQALPSYSARFLTEAELERSNLVAAYFAFVGIGDSSFTEVIVDNIEAATGTTVVAIRIEVAYTEAIGELAFRPSIDHSPQLSTSQYGNVQDTSY